MTDLQLRASAVRDILRAMPSPLMMRRFAPSLAALLLCLVMTSGDLHAQRVMDARRGVAPRVTQLRAPERRLVVARVSPLRGALIGAVAGAIVGGVVGYASCDRCDDAAPVVYAIGVGAAIGAGVGVITGLVLKARRTESRRAVR